MLWFCLVIVDPKYSQQSWNQSGWILMGSSTCDECARQYRWLWILVAWDWYCQFVGRLLFIVVVCANEGAGIFVGSVHQTHDFPREHLILWSSVSLPGGNQVDGLPPAPSNDP